MSSKKSEFFRGATNDVPTIKEIRNTMDFCAKSMFRYTATQGEDNLITMTDSESDKTFQFSVNKTLGQGSFGMVFSLNGFDNYVMKLFLDRDGNEELSSHVAEAASSLLFGRKRKVCVPAHPVIPLARLVTVEDEYVVMFTERYDMDLFKFMMSFEEKPIRMAEMFKRQKVITATVHRMYQMMLYSGFICLDRRPPNLLIKVNEDEQLYDIRLSDMDLGLCCTLYGSIARNALTKYYIKLIDKGKKERHLNPWSSYETAPGMVDVPTTLSGVKCSLSPEHIDMVVELQSAFTLIPLGIYPQRKLEYIQRYFEDVFNNPKNAEDEKIKTLLSNDYERTFQLLDEPNNVGLMG